MLNLELHYELPVVKILQGLSIRELGEMIVATLPPLASQVPKIEHEVQRPVLHNNGNGAGPAVHTNGASHSSTHAMLPGRHWSRGQRVARFCTRRFLDVATSLRVEGLERLPANGAYILASNHLSWADMPVLLAELPRPVTVMTAEWVQESAVTKWLASAMGDAIFVRRGEGDQKALEDGLNALLAGEVLAVSPEGTRSKSGGLQQAYTGAAYLAFKAQVPVVPLALWGQERLSGSWRSMRRAGVQIRVGAPLDVPVADASAVELRRHTDRIMFALAELLPESYRGVYSSQTGDEL